MRTKTIGRILALCAVVLPFAVMSPPAQAGSGLPAGRGTYVVSVLGGTNLHMYSKLATYLFSTNGTVTQKYWYWRQDSITGYSNSAKWKPSSGATTATCKRNCPVRTPLGFQRGTAPKSMTGSWHMNSSNNLVIQWTADAYETWKLDTSQSGFVGATVLFNQQSQHIQRGWGFGSNASPNVGVGMGTVHASSRLYGPLVMNDFGVSTRVLMQGFNFALNYQNCSSGTCTSSNTTSAYDKRTWYHSYLAGNPTLDGRKVYWDSQTGAVQQAESPTSVCIGSGGGHTDAALQVIDDHGIFRGLVGVEASLDRQAYRMDMVGAWADVLTPMLTTIDY